MSISWVAVLTATLTIATPLVFGALGAILNERAGVLNLGIEGTMYAGAFAGFWAADRWSSAWAGLAAAVVAGALAGALMGLLTVTIGVNQHVAGIGTTLGALSAIGVLLVALLLGTIGVGAQNASLVLQIPSQMGQLVTAVLLLAVVSCLALRHYRVVRRRTIAAEVVT